jgi:arylsulfatase A-like enzyme
MNENKKILFTSGLISIGLTATQSAFAIEKSNNNPPNFIIIFVDDMGYGDLGIYGNPNINTPNLDRMANEGQKWTNFYVAASVSTPSRAGLLTGRLPIRSGMCSSKRRVLFPDSNGGLPQSEITIAKALKTKGYHTSAIGKWHLGHKTSYLPIHHGFDSYFGIPYSNDMDKADKTNYFQIAEEEHYQSYNVPLMRDDKIIERPTNQLTITKRYTEEAIKKIKEYKSKPFFIYLAHSLPHIPLFRSADFKGISKAGIYGDVVEEIDWSVGEILKTLKEEGIDENTMVIFTSDNGPWQVYKTHGGSSGLLKGSKGGTFEGGMRVPCIMRWPGKIKSKVVRELGTTMDLFPTFCHLTGIKLPDDRNYDGYDISPIIFGMGKTVRDVVFFYRGTEVYAIRKGKYKAHFITQAEYGEESKIKIVHDIPLLFNLDVDPSEKYDISKEHPEVITEIKRILTEHNATVVSVENQLEKL